MRIILAKQKAFSLVETIIAVSIIALVLLFSVTLGSASLRNIISKAQSAQATVIARSNLEKVRNIRDNSWIKNNCVGLSDCNNDWDYWVKSDYSQKVNLGENYLINQLGQNYYLEPVTGAEPTRINSMRFGENSEISYRSVIRVKKVTDFDNDFQIIMDNYQGSDSSVNLTSANPKIYLIESEVSWDIYGRTENVVLKTYLSDWLPRF